MTSGSEYTGRSKDTRFEININGETYGANAKKRLAFTDTIEADPLIPESMSRIGDGTRANLRGGTSASEMVDSRGAGPIDIKWCLQSFLPATIEERVMAKLIQI